MAKKPIRVSDDSYEAVQEMAKILGIPLTQAADRMILFAKTIGELAGEGRRVTVVKDDEKHIIHLP